MPKTAVLVSGFARSGKSTFAALATEEYDFTEVTLAGPLKTLTQRMLCDVYGLRLSDAQMNGLDGYDRNRVMTAHPKNQGTLAALVLLFVLEGLGTIAGALSQSWTCFDVLVIMACAGGVCATLPLLRAKPLTLAGRPLTVRWALQCLGTEWCREHIHDKVWVDAALRNITDSGRDRVIISDVRFRNEAGILRQGLLDLGYTVSCVHLERPGAEVVSGTHVSESGFVPEWAQHLKNQGSMLEFQGQTRVLLDALVAQPMEEDHEPVEAVPVVEEEEEVQPVPVEEEEEVQPEEEEEDPQ